MNNSPSAKVLNYWTLGKFIPTFKRSNFSMITIASSVSEAYLGRFRKFIANLFLQK